MKVMLVAGARPNFAKVACILDALDKFNQSSDRPIVPFLVHTGQHYDDQMSDAFFRDLAMAKPDVDLGVGSASHAQQTAEIMRRFEPVLFQERPDVVLVVGDVNSTVACSLVASKAVYPCAVRNSERPGPLVAHVEAGLRSFDRSMPEEINRVLTDALSDLLFITEKSAAENLTREGIAKEKIYFVGNTMVDTLLKHREKANDSKILCQLGLNGGPPLSSGRDSQNKQCRDYGILTLHRPSNVDGRETFQEILESLAVVAKEIPIFFPVHPRTLNRIKEFGFERYFTSVAHGAWRMAHSAELLALNSQPLTPVSRPQLSTLASELPAPCSLLSLSSDSCSLPARIYCLPPLGYLDFLCLMSNARLVLTDSGGIQEETTVLGIPCVTLRENTERPVTMTQGSNVLAGTKREEIIRHALGKLHDPVQPRTPELWDGRAGERIVKILAKLA
ncbi:MAG: UDP-N-acetyl glucosamine 2-epimerase [Deltaproteobacteria bacterium]|nr:UDP-N-acetyl glucosamine 2-epimerase [Deltaproteobacteria bacterium]